jgi:PAS domain S-box-containing protein
MPWRELEALPSSVGAARRIVERALEQAERPDLGESAALVASELVTNALLHAGTGLAIRVQVDPDGALVEVRDESPSLPGERDHATLAGTGRGLALVAQVSTAWGAEETATGKTVWARVTAPLPDGAGPGGHQVNGRPLVGAAAGPPPRRVQLLNVPLLMHLAWHQHAESLMREYLLARLEDDELVALQEHALVSEALTILHDQIPVPDLPGGSRSLEDVDQLLMVFTDPTATLDSGWLEIPEESLRAFEVLDDAIEAAIALADADLLLAPPTQPELRELRRWICEEITRQAAGARPTAWQPPAPGAAAPSGVDGSTWDAVPVLRSERALLAADDTDRIVAVSGPALRLLGYDRPEELIGCRVLVVIPERFHQAHLAGFTMYLTTGRQPLIGATVTVPFVRRDAREVPLRLTIATPTTAGTRRVFVAELRPAT